MYLLPREYVWVGMNLCMSVSKFINNGLRGECKNNNTSWVINLKIKKILV